MAKRRDENVAVAVGKTPPLGRKIPLFIFLAIILILIFASGCGNGGNGAESDTDSPAVASETAVTPAVVSEAAVTPADEESSAVADATDNSLAGNTLGIDLTSFDELTASTVAHEIFENPNEYLETKIKLRGHYESADNGNTGGKVHSVVIKNEAGCCQPIFEFIWNGEHVYPKDYPEDFSEIEVEGVLKTYEEEGTTYYYLAADDVSNMS